MRQYLRAFARDRKGATAIEYTLIVALVSLAIISAVDELADSTSVVFNTVTSTIVGASDPGSSDPGSNDDDSNDDDSNDDDSNDDDDCDGKCDTQ